MTSPHQQSPERGPYETCIMAMLVVGSISTLFPYGGVPRTIDTVLDPIMLRVWSIMLLVGSVLTLIGIAWRGRYVTALGVERIGLILHTCACLVYTVALIAHWDQHNGAIVLTTFIAAIAIANLWRIRQIGSSIRRMVALSLLTTEEGE